jgi:acyl-CoA reductase-like NAD-dependent aldehyde dehydrogenase
MLIDGAWVQADSGRSLEICNPATGELVARVPGRHLIAQGNPAAAAHWLSKAAASLAMPNEMTYCNAR